MNERELTDKEYARVYEEAVREFNTSGMHYKQTYSHFLVRCVIKAFLSFLQSNNLEVRNGRVCKKEENQCQS